MITDRLYYEDAYLRSFDARVAAVRQDGWIALDRSAFYPTSGGQPYDTGTLACGGHVARVTDVQVENNVVWHQVDGTAWPVGALVHGEIDWERRLDHMQQHAADHMLAGAAWELYGGVTIGLHLGKESSTIDMALPDGRTRLTEKQMDALENLVNRRVQQDAPIRCWFPSAEELSALPLRKKPTVTEHVRVVAMGDYEMVACGGTHPPTTGRIGPIKILSCTPSRGKMRLCFVAGMRAVDYFRKAAKSAGAVAAALSCAIEDAPESLQKERDAHAAQRKEGAQRLAQAAVQAIRAQRRGNVYAAHLPFADHDTLLRAAAELTAQPEAIVLLSCPRGEGRLLVFARGAAAMADMAQLLRKSGARGGGKPDMAQGSAADDLALKTAVDLLQASSSAP
ncbi:MAG: hypothetical protein IJ189_04490 [Clostridia bacterium]|nr:hypothetical protein [Clostridia bacterium]